MYFNMSVLWFWRVKYYFIYTLAGIWLVLTSNLALATSHPVTEIFTANSKINA